MYSVLAGRICTSDFFGDYNRQCGRCFTLKPLYHRRQVCRCTICDWHCWGTS